MPIPSWAIFSLAASLLFGTVNLLDKYILGRFNLNPWIYLALDGFVGVFALLVIPLFVNPQSLLVCNVIVWGIVSGITLAGFNILYFVALQKSNISIIVIFLQATPIFSLIWDILVWGKYYSFISIIGIVLVLLGICVAVIAQESQHKDELHPQKNSIPAIVYMLGATFFLSLSYLTNQIALVETTVLPVYFWQRFSLVIISIIVIMRHHLLISSINFQPIMFTSMVELFVAIGLLLLTAALQHGPLTIVTLLLSLQPFWVVIISWVSNRSKLKFLPFSQDVPIYKLLISLFIIFLGLLLIRGS